MGDERVQTNPNHVIVVMPMKLIPLSISYEMKFHNNNKVTVAIRTKGEIIENETGYVFTLLENKERTNFLNEDTKRMSSMYGNSAFPQDSL